MTAPLLAIAALWPVGASSPSDGSAGAVIFLGGLIILIFFADRILRLRQRLREDQIRRLEFQIEREQRLIELDEARHVRVLDKAAREQDVGRRRSSKPRARLRAASERGHVFEDVWDSLADGQQRLAWHDLGVDADDAIVRRYLPVSIYVSSDDPQVFYELRDAVELFLKEFGFEVVSEMRVERGSIMQRLTAKLRAPSTKEELGRAFAVAQLALQQQTLGKAQAEINLQGAQAAAALAQTLASSDDCVVAFGAMIGATRRDADGPRSTVIIELTPEELMQFQRGGRALNSASAAFDMLARLRPDEYLRQTSDSLDGDQGLGAPHEILELPPGP